MSVKVAVRVRPFNSREKQMNCLLCVGMEGNKTILQDIGDATKNRDFSFDYSFWSHDQFEINEEGLSIPTGPRYADQQHVYNTVGKEILDNAWQGYHCCLFAYGQTGAGKSYSMVGYGINRGIVPITCEEIFKRIHTNTDPNRSYDVQVSMLEIYNEKVQDLLIPVAKRAAGGLKVREHKVYGVYVEGLTKHSVSSYDAIEASMELGNRHRTIASTQMNASSSRAHTIIQVEFKSITKEADNRSSEKLSVINLVDLAGSEKVGKTGATGDRLKEAGQINKSLSVLGQVISALADKAMGKAKNQVVPYRDSSLTRILQNALGGNSKTLMICAVSPANDNYDETLSTLRYADQAKKIKNNAMVNESDSERMIRQLKEENDLLKQQLQNMQKQFQRGEFDASQMDELQSNLESNAHFMEQIMNPVHDMLEEEPPQASVTVPHLTNVNEDPMLNGKVVYPLTSDITRIGRKNGHPTPQIILAGIGIQDNHAYIENVDGVFYLAESSQFLFLNGDPVHERQMLSNDNRLILGTATTLLVRLPDQSHTEFDWEQCWRELGEKQELRRQVEAQRQEQELNREMQLKVEQLEADNRREREEAETLMKQQREEFEKQLKVMESQIAETALFQKQKVEAEKALRERLLLIQSERSEREQQREMRRRDLEDEDCMKRYRMKEKAFIEQKLRKFLPMIIETNLIAKELKRNVKLEARLKYVYAEQLDFETMDLDALSKGQLFIRVINNEEQETYHWSLPKFENRYYLIKELFEASLEFDEMVKLPNDKDPFWDPPEGKFIGQAFIKLESLTYLMDNPSELPLVGERINNGGITVNLIPTDKAGVRNLSNDIDEGLIDEVEDPTDLLNSRLDFLVVIESANIDENPCGDCYVEYTIQRGRKPIAFRTQKVAGVRSHPKFDYRQQHNFEVVTNETLDYLLTGTICFELYGFEKVKMNQQTDPQDLDLLMRKKRLTIDNQRRATKQPQDERRVSRQMVREKVNSFQALNPSQMRKPTLTQRMVLQPLPQIQPQQLQQQPKQQQQQQQPPSNKTSIDNTKAQGKTPVIKAPEPSKPTGQAISYEDLQKFDTKGKPQKKKDKDKDCALF